MHKVLVTGIGVVSPNGADVAEFWGNLLAAETRPNESFLELGDRLPNKFIYTCAPSSDSPGPDRRALAMAEDAVAQAMGDAGLTGIPGFRAGISVGTTMGEEALRETRRAAADGTEECVDFPFQVAAQVAARFGCHGPNHTFSNACTSGLYALDIAAGVIRDGEADIMIAGGVECASRIVLACFNRLGALDQEACRPFDRERKGTVLGEGAAFVVLESEESWERRGGNRPYGELKGSGWSCDAHQPTAPDPDGTQVERALRESLGRSRIEPWEVECILPHGTGTPLNDALESRILADVFGGQARQPAMTAIKSKLGHSGGASGAFSLITACLILRHGRVPPTANLRDLEGPLPIRIPVHAPLEGSFRNILINAYAFGGNNISVMVGGVDGAGAT